jgi:hypothetical protein
LWDSCTSTPAINLLVACGGLVELAIDTVNASALCYASRTTLAINQSVALWFVDSGTLVPQADVSYQSVVLQLVPP